MSFIYAQLLIWTIVRAEKSAEQQDKINQKTLGLLSQQKIALDSSVNSLEIISKVIQEQSILHKENLVQMGKVAALNRRSVVALEKQVAELEKQPNLMLAVGPDIPSAVKRNSYPPQDLRKYVWEKDFGKKINMHCYTTPSTEEGSSPVTHFSFAIKIRNFGTAKAILPRLTAIVVDDQNERIRYSGYKFENQCSEARVRTKYTEEAKPLEDILPYSQTKSDKLYHFTVNVTGARAFVIDISVEADNHSRKDMRITVVGTDRLYEPTTNEEP